MWDDVPLVIGKAFSHEEFLFEVYSRGLLVGRSGCKIGPSNELLGAE